MGSAKQVDPVFQWYLLKVVDKNFDAHAPAAQHRQVHTIDPSNSALDMGGRQAQRLDTCLGLGEHQGHLLGE